VPVLLREMNYIVLWQGRKFVHEIGLGWERRYWLKQSDRLRSLVVGDISCPKRTVGALAVNLQ